MTKIQAGAFQGCEKLTSIEVPASVVDLEHRVFLNCTSLKTASILGSVKALESALFGGCAALETVTLGPGAKKVDISKFNGTFKGCTAIKVINVPAKKVDYYKKRLPEELHGFIVELPAEKKK